MPTRKIPAKTHAKTHAKTPANKNPFVPQAKFHGKSARLRAWEGGFHTALEKDFTVAYAQQKWSTSPRGGYVECLDYPVILTLDMTNLPSIADIDSRRACKELYEMYVRYHNRDNDEFIRWARDFELEDYQEVGDHVQNALFNLASPSSLEVSVRLLRDWLEDSQSEEQENEKLAELERLGRILTKNENARLNQEDDALLIDVFKQAVYWIPVECERVLQVEYMHPYWERVVPDDTDTDPEEGAEETIKEALDAGFDLLSDQDRHLQPFLVQAWARPNRSTPMFGDDPAERRVEYHGTSLSNLLFACPGLADELRDPPKPAKEGALQDLRHSDM